MSAVRTPTVMTPVVARPALKVTQGRVLRSELTKFRSLRSTMYTLLTAVVLMIGLGALFSALTASQYHTYNAADRASFNPVTTSLSGVMFAVVAFGVLGVLVTGGGYSTGMIRSSLTAVPRRLPVLWGKLAVFAGTVFSVALVASFVSFFIGQALLNTHHLGVSITSPDALRSVIGAALYVTVAATVTSTSNTQRRAGRFAGDSTGCRSLMLGIVLLVQASERRSRQAAAAMRTAAYPHSSANPVHGASPFVTVCDPPHRTAPALEGR